MDDALLARVLPTFREEAEEHLRTIEDALLRLERGPAPAVAEAMFLAAHSLKGGAASLGLADLEALAHAMESALGPARRTGTIAPGLADAALNAVDVARAALRAHADEGPVAGARVEHAVKVLESAASAPSEAAADERPPPAAGPLTVSTRVSPEVLEALAALAAASGEVLARAAQRLPEVEAALAGLAEPQRSHLQGVLRALDADLLELATETGAAYDLLGELRTRRAAEAFVPARRMVRDLARRQGKEVWLRVQGGEVALDPALADAVREALVHLVRNAVDHGAESPEERARAGKPAACTVTLSAEARGGEVVIAVEDDGRGVDRAALRAAVARAGLDAGAPEGAGLEAAFVPGVSTRADAGLVSGRGVGLPAVRERVKGLGGQVRMESTEGQGTRVELVLPRRPGARVSPRRARVVVADDSAATRALYRSVLEGAGYRVETAGDGAEAEALAASADLVITDVTMPRMDGIELARRVGAKVPLLIVSATASDAEKQQGLEAGARGYYSKRVLASDALLRAVDEALSAPR